MTTTIVHKKSKGYEKRCHNGQERTYAIVYISQSYTYCFGKVQQLVLAGRVMSLSVLLFLLLLLLAAKIATTLLVASQVMSLTYS